MTISRRKLELIYRISATIRYNTERNLPLFGILKRILTEDLKELSLSEALKVQEEETQRLYRERPLIISLFEFQHNVSFGKIDMDNALDYVEKMYMPFTERDQCGDVAEIIVILILLSYSLLFVSGKKAQKIGFRADTYKFNNKQEYGDLTYSVVPGNKYIYKWRESITLDKSEILQDVSLAWSSRPSGAIPNWEKIVESLLDELSFTEEEAFGNAELSFLEKPLMKLDSEKYLLLGYSNVISVLPYRCNQYLKRCKKYRERKGDIFENVTVELLNNKLGDSVHPDIKYDNGQADAMLNLDESTWFVEVTSHPPNINSFRGNDVSIEEDLRKSVIKCINQGKRDILNSNAPQIIRFNPKPSKGFIVVLNEHYPNFSATQHKYYKTNQDVGDALIQSLHDPFPKSPFPRLIISYLELKEILSQPDSYLFERFLIWRTQENMPIICQDELDYWDFFSRMQNEEDIRKIFTALQERQSYLNYIGSRFNNKDYLEKIRKTQFS